MTQQTNFYFRHLLWIIKLCTSDCAFCSILHSFDVWGLLLFTKTWLHSYVLTKPWCGCYGLQIVYFVIFYTARYIFGFWGPLLFTKTWLPRVIDPCINPDVRVVYFRLCICYSFTKVNNAFSLLISSNVFDTWSFKPMVKKILIACILFLLYTHLIKNQTFTSTRILYIHACVKVTHINSIS